MMDTQNTNFDKLRKLIVAGLCVYLVAIPFQTLIDLPYIGRKAQLPELLFIPVFVLSIIYIFWRRRFDFQPCLMDSIPILWISILFVTTFASGMKLQGILECVGAIYLGLVYFVFRLFSNKGNLKLYIKAYIVGAALAGVIGLLGIFLAMAGIHVLPVWPGHEFPYFGHVWRALGYTPAPSMLASVLLTGICLQLGLWHTNQKIQVREWLLLGIMLLGLLSTVSKDMLNLLIAFLVMGLLVFRVPLKKIRYLILSACFFIFIVFISITHFYIHFGTPDQLTQVLEGRYVFIAPAPFGKIFGYPVFETTYFVLKRTAILAFSQNPLFGVGPGGFNDFVELQRLQGNYPVSFPNFDPHSSYIGTLAELGIAGGVIGIVIMILIAYCIIHAIRGQQNLWSEGIIAAVTGCFVAYASNAFLMDIGNFRHVWFLLAVLAFVYSIQPGKVSATGYSSRVTSGL